VFVSLYVGLSLLSWGCFVLRGLQVSFFTWSRHSSFQVIGHLDKNLLFKFGVFSPYALLVFSSFGLWFFLENLSHTSCIFSQPWFIIEASTTGALNELTYLCLGYQ
jgi:hypothetical protein